MSKATLERNTFVKGLITEANPLTFPENASIDEDNFVLNRDGSRQRRNGMDYENDHALVSTGYANSNFSSVAISSFLWKNVGEDPTLTVAVVQVGRTLHFLDAGTANPSDNEIGTLTLSAIYDNSPFQYTAIKGVLILVNEADESGPAYISYDGSTFTRTAYDVKVRDIWGMDDGLEVDERPTTLSTTHLYNLHNQGWTQSALVSMNYPSNADVMSLGKNSSDDFDAGLMRKQLLGNTPAAKGSAILDLYDRSTSRRNFSQAILTAASSTIVLDPFTDIENGRLTTAATYSGRVFYAGVASSVTGGDSLTPNYTGTIFFTRVVDSLSRLGVCHQEADPTSEHISDLLPTDGGTIEIPEASRIHRLISKGTSLVAFAENGVWEITGRDGVFAADDFFVRRVTNVGSIGPGSVVNVEESVMYWSEGGIYVLTPNDQDLLVVQNLSESTIQSFYTDIPAVGRLYSKGNYDPISKKVSWLYNNINNYESNQINNYNKELILDTVLGSFYTSSIGSIEEDSPYISGYIQVTEYLSIDRIDNVVVNGVPVTVNGEQVVVTTPTRSSGTGVTKYLTIIPDDTDNKLTLSYYNNVNFLDWYTADSTGVDAPAYLVTGYELFQDSQRRKYIPYLTMHFKRTETGFTNSGGSLVPVGASSCLVQAQWDFANSATSGKWGTPFQTYRLTRAYMPVDVNDTFDYGHAVISTKNRVRGSGRAFSMKLYTEAGKDCHIYGWAMLAEGSTGV